MWDSRVRLQRNENEMNILLHDQFSKCIFGASYISAPVAQTLAGDVRYGTTTFDIIEKIFGNDLNAKVLCFAHSAGHSLNLIFGRYDCGHFLMDFCAQLAAHSLNKFLDVFFRSFRFANNHEFHVVEWRFFSLNAWPGPRKKIKN